MIATLPPVRSTGRRVRKETDMLPSFTVGQFRKAAASSPQQACVMVGRDDEWTVVWDDKLANRDTTTDAVVPRDQCLYFSHSQFDAFQEAIRSGNPIGHCLKMTLRNDGTYVFSAADPAGQPASARELHFDGAEYDAFMTGIHNREFDLQKFKTAA
ncbi:hypothetical protein [Nocardia gipuzkoensis]|uniref:hypothetical protein n=1 Tax=Nocardia gipuzkoensis TaxID=2749991 RepID=UPI00237E76AF|nr:hypothetical protein [Nocardia gipuzkoensis]MDE1674746.1 hypothetical protein [Nocardia gipuzkoensis]